MNQKPDNKKSMSNFGDIIVRLSCHIVMALLKKILWKQHTEAIQLTKIRSNKILAF